MKNPFFGTDDEPEEPINAFLYPERAEELARKREAERLEIERDIKSQTLRLPRKK
jgi:hypothetical protein